MTPSRTGSCRYFIRSRDPSGEFIGSYWETAVLPRVGEEVMLPDGDGWQEMTVTEIRHYPHVVDVWLGGTDGWEPGSVLRLFREAQKRAPQL